MNLCIKFNQGTITRGQQLQGYVYVTAFSQIKLFLDESHESVSHQRGLPGFLVISAISGISINLASQE